MSQASNRPRPGPDGGKRARNREERTRTLLEAGRRLFLSHGVEAVSIDELAREAGMAKGNFYRYFDDKRSLVDQLVAPLAVAIRSQMTRCAVRLERASSSAEVADAYARLALGLAEAALSRLDLVQLYLQESRAPRTAARAGLHSLSDELTTGAIQLTQVAVEHRLLQVTQPAVTALAVVGAVERLALATLHQELTTPPAEVAQIVVKMVLEGIRSFDRPGSEL